MTPLLSRLAVDGVTSHSADSGSCLRLLDVDVHVAVWSTMKKWPNEATNEQSFGPTSKWTRASTSSSERLLMRPFIRASVSMFVRASVGRCIRLKDATGSVMAN